VPYTSSCDCLHFINEELHSYILPSNNNVPYIGEKAAVEVEMKNTVMVVHGPEPFDRGDVARIMELAKPQEVIVAGVMGRTAAEESGLAVTYADDPPSSVVRNAGDRAFIVNHGKNPESGRIFGDIVAQRVGAEHGLVQIECSDETIYLWDNGDRKLAEDLSACTGFPVIHAEASPEAAPGIRVIRGCIPGEAVFVNGVVIGVATAGEVVVRHSGRKLEAVAGIDFKPHGLEKLLRKGSIDPASAWCKSGSLRSRTPHACTGAPLVGRVLVIDHCGHMVYRHLDPGVCGVLSIGDDTTSVCAHICAHRGIPVFGVIDGDCDGIVEPSYAPGSVVVMAGDASDDDLGRELATCTNGEEVCWQTWVERALHHLHGRVKIVVDLRNGDQHNALC